VRLTKMKRCGHGYKKGIHNWSFLGTELVRHNQTLYLTFTGWSSIFLASVLFGVGPPFQVGT